MLQGRRYVSAQMAELLVCDLDSDSDQPVHRRLSEREFQIFCKLATGQTVSGIGNELYLSAKTVSTYRSRILEKMNPATNADITTLACWKTRSSNTTDGARYLRGRENLCFITLSGS